nr:transposase [uncultured Roseovarius sp.]
MTKRKRYSVEFKAKVALETIREGLTKAELAKKYDIHPTMIRGRKRAAIENMAQAFSGQTTAEPTISAAEIEKLHAKIGHLVVERDAPQRLRCHTGATVAASMSEALNLIPGTGGRKR